MILAEVRMMMVCADWRKDGWIEKKYLFQKRLENMLDKNIRRVPVAVPSRLVPADRCWSRPSVCASSPHCRITFLFIIPRNKTTPFSTIQCQNKGCRFPPPPPPLRCLSRLPPAPRPVQVPCVQCVQLQPHRCATSNSNNTEPSHRHLRPEVYHSPEDSLWIRLCPALNRRRL